MNDPVSQEDVLMAMRVYGGGFAQALAECFRRADSQNWSRLMVAFPDYWDCYSRMARAIRDSGDHSESVYDTPVADE